MSSGSAAYDQVKGKVHLQLDKKTQRSSKVYSSSLSLTLGLDGVRRERHAPAALTPVNIRYSLYRRLDAPQGRSGQMRKI